MKKFFSLMMIAAAFAFVACGDPVNDEPTGSSKLTTPVVTIVDVEAYGFTAQWEAVAGAESYTINMKGKNYTTEELSYKFEKLNPGEYQVRVKATGKGYEDSDFGSAVATLTGATEVEWFTQTVSLPETEIPEEGLFRYNSIDFTWKGTGITDLRYNLYVAADIEGIDAKDIQADLSSLGESTGAILDEVNGDGFHGQFGGVLDGGTEYALCVEVTNADGLEFFTISKISTESFDIPAETQAWIGTWNATTSKVLTLNDNGVGTLSDKTESFTFTVAASSQAPDMVIVDGLSVLGEGNPTKGYVDGNTLTIVTNLSIGYNADQDIYYYWLPYIALDGELMGLNMFESEVPAHVLTMAEDGTVVGETGKFSATDQNGSEVAVEVISSEVYGVNSQGQLFFFIDAFPAVYRAGAMQVTKAANPTAKALNKVAKNYPMSLSSVVL